MIQHIKCVVIFLLLISLSCSGNNILERDKQDKSVLVNHGIVEFENFVFFKSFQFCDNAFAAFTGEEANRVYLNKVIRFDLKAEREPLNWDSFCYEGSKRCVEEELGEKQTSSCLVSTNEDSPFDRIILFNNKYLLFAQDGFFFVFKEDKKGESVSESSTNQVEEHPTISKNSWKSIVQILDGSKTTSLPLEYSYELISELKNFTMIQEQQLDGLEHLSDFQFSKLPSSGKTKLLLVSGYMESGQSEMYLITVNDSFEKVDAVLLYTSREIEEGSISTRFEISKDHKITTTKLERGKISKVLETKVFGISQDGNFEVTK